MNTFMGNWERLIWTGCLLAWHNIQLAKILHFCKNFLTKKYSVFQWFWLMWHTFLTTNFFAFWTAAVQIVLVLSCVWIGGHCNSGRKLVNYRFYFTRNYSVLPLSLSKYTNLFWEKFRSGNGKAYYYFSFYVKFLGGKELEKYCSTQ